MSVPLAGHLPPDQAELLAQVVKCLAETLAVLGLEKQHQDEGKRCGGDKETKPEDSLRQAQGDLQQRGKNFDFTKLPSYQRLPFALQALLQSILDSSDKAKKEAMDLFQDAATHEQSTEGDRKRAKAFGSLHRDREQEARVA